MKIAFIIPFRHRDSGDPYRQDNLNTTYKWVSDMGLGSVAVCSDGRSGDEQFNRSAAYNMGVRQYKDADVYVFYESDLLVQYKQILQGIDSAVRSEGLVVPFSRFLSVNEYDSQVIRENPAYRLANWSFDTQVVRGYQKSIGAVNIVSRYTMAKVGQWDENFEGAWYDDDSMEIAFRVCCRSTTRFVLGDGYHLYHRPSAGAAAAAAAADGLSDADKAATSANKERWKRYRKARTPEEIRHLTLENKKITRRSS